MADSSTVLNETERNYAELMDAYLTFRRSLPTTETGEGLIAEPKTTQDIRDELADMMIVPADFIFSYMLRRGYGFTTGTDGAVKWAVWRIPLN